MIINEIKKEFKCTTFTICQPWKQQYVFNISENNDITEWTEISEPNLPGFLTFPEAVITKNRAYLLGGLNIYKVSKKVYTAIIDESGVLGEWIETDPLPEPLYNFQAFVIKNYLYLFGGNNGRYNLNTIYKSKIKHDGTLGDWIKEQPLPLKVVGTKIIVTGNYIYVLGGDTGDGITRLIYRAKIYSKGDIGVWKEYDFLPAELSHYQVIFTNNYLYLLGGYSVFNHRVGISKSIYRAKISENGILGKLTEVGFLPDYLAFFQAIVTRNKVYLLGGDNEHDAIDSIYAAKIYPDGTLGNWRVSGSLPYHLLNFQVITTKNYIYLLGGMKMSKTKEKIELNSCVLRANFSGGLNDYSSFYS